MVLHNVVANRRLLFFVVNLSVMTGLTRLAVVFGMSVAKVFFYVFKKLVRKSKAWNLTLVRVQIQYLA